MTEYLTTKKVNSLPRLPLEGSIDLTYRCNNNCRHCWLWIPENSPEKEKELSLEEIKRIVDEARSMGCQKWILSGGEPMLREDFSEIFDYITRNSIGYSINTNGTLITPRIARLMKRKGRKWVALYGATADVHDHITRNPGSFDAVMRGISCLKEAGAAFVAQIIPMKDNYHQFEDMKKLAQTLSPNWRIGINWLYLSASGNPEKNEEIRAQRLSPMELNDLEKFGFYEKDIQKKKHEQEACLCCGDDHLFTACIAARRDFHIDPYGQMSFCDKIKEPLLRYDLRKGSLRQCWEIFIPELSEKIKGGSEYLNNCGPCELRKDCSWCPVYGYLEHRRFSAKVDYLCEIAEQKKRTEENFAQGRRRYYQMAGITIQVNSDLPITNETFHPKLRDFEITSPGDDIVRISHHFFLPDMDGRDFGKEVYRKPPWAIYKKKNSWIYVWTGPSDQISSISFIAVFNDDHTRARTYSDNEDKYHKGNLQTLTFFPTDQLPLARVMADREGCFLHSSGLVLQDRGLLFVGHSEAGKSTIVKLLKSQAKILCDERIVVRKWADGFRIHGTWGHGEMPDISPDSAPLNAIFFLEKSDKNQLIKVENRQDAFKNIWACLIKGFPTGGWWDKILPLIEELVREVPCYTLRFNRSGGVVDLLKSIDYTDRGQNMP